MKKILILLLLTLFFTVSYSPESIAVRPVSENTSLIDGNQMNKGDKFSITGNTIDNEDVSKKPKKKKRKKKKRKQNKAKKLLIWTIITGVGGLLLLILGYLLIFVFANLTGILLFYLFSIIGSLSLTASSILFVIWLIEVLD